MRRRLTAFAWLLDSSMPIPGTKLRIGIDALIGLVPGIGDLLGVLLSSYVVAQSARMGAPRTLLVRMALNVAIEGFFGSVPIFGDVFDAIWKANLRNVRLLEHHLERPREAKLASRAFVAAIVAVLIAMLAAFGVLTYYLLSWLVATGSTNGAG
jgi:hypothetical protein